MNNAHKIPIVYPQKKIAILTGITGQTSSFMADLLLSKDYKIIGVKRRSSTPNFRNIEHILDKIQIVEADILDFSAMFDIFSSVKGEDVEVYNFAAQSHVWTSFNNPLYTFQATGLAVLNILEAIRKSGLVAKFYQASSSEMFGNSFSYPQDENTPFNPVSPYGAAKLFAHNLVIQYRNAYDMFNVAPIMFNCESKRRGENFVTRKITRGMAAISKGKSDILYLGNLNSIRDFGHAEEYVEAIWRVMQAKNPEEYTICTGVSASIRELLDYCAELSGVDIEKHVIVNEKFKRPNEINKLHGSYQKIHEKLDWKPTKFWKDVIKEMYTYDLANV